MEKLKEKLWEELEEISRKPELGAGDLELVHKLTDTIKNIDKICILEGEDGYNATDEDFGRGASYANRGKHYVRAHYSRNVDRDSYRPRRGGRDGYSQDDGRSEMMEHLEEAVNSANDQDREMIKRFMRQLEQA